MKDHLWFHHGEASGMLCVIGIRIEQPRSRVESEHGRSIRRSSVDGNKTTFIGRIEVSLTISNRRCDASHALIDQNIRGDPMTITDLTSMAEAQVAERKEINDRLQKLMEEVSDYCFQCGKCTSGCEAHKLLELEPHKIVALLKRGLIDEMINSDIIWTCMSCFKCKERCPQGVAPVNILFTLKNLAVASGKQVPGDFTAMLQSVMGMGLMQDVQQVTTRSGEIRKREDMGLSECSKPKDPAKFQSTVMTVAMEKV